MAPTPAEAAQEFCKLRGFEYIENLDAGAFKVVFKVERAGEIFALKVAPILISAERLSRETIALQSCDHHSIAVVHEGALFELKGAKFWIVIEEFLPGGTLERKLAERLMLPAEARALGLSLADALIHLQDKRLVHRDVKPANVLFRDDGVSPVLTDFGIVRMLDEPTITQAFAIQGPGTPAFASPEQLNNEKDLIDARTDQFCLAVVLTGAIFGHHPYMENGETIHHAIERVRAKQSLPGATVEKLAGVGFSSLVTALEPWPAKRFRRATDFADALKEI